MTVPRRRVERDLRADQRQELRDTQIVRLVGEGQLTRSEIAASVGLKRRALLYRLEYLRPWIAAHSGAGPFP